MLLDCAQKFALQLCSVFYFSCPDQVVEQTDYLGFGHAVGLCDRSALGKCAHGVRGCGKSKAAVLGYLSPCLLLQKSLVPAI